MKKYWLYLTLLILCIGFISAQDYRKAGKINFRVSRSDVQPSYMNNAESLEDIISAFESIADNDSLKITGIRLYGGASPDGGYNLNRRLSQKRLANFESYLRNRTDIPDSLITYSDNSIAWEELALLVEQSDMKNRDEVLDILRNVPEFTYDVRGKLIDSRKKRLMDMQYGRTWNYMKDNFFNDVRAAGISLDVERIIMPEPIVEEPVVQESDTIVEIVDTVVKVEEVKEEITEEVVDTVVEAPKKPFYMALKTNMLYDVLGVPGIGAEFYLGKNISIVGNWMYGWWKTDKKHDYWRFYGGDLAVRYWFGKEAKKKPLTGHHAGVFGQLFTYDFELGGKGYMGGQPGGTLWDEMNYAVGLEYGYSLPIAKRLNIDFTLGIGYWGGKYYIYKPIDNCYVWQETRQRHWFGPVKAEISLVWLIGRGNINEKKQK